jgi:hypothetical protein
MAGHSIFGIFTNRQGIEVAVKALKDAEFRSSDISIARWSGWVFLNLKRSAMKPGSIKAASFCLCMLTTRSGSRAPRASWKNRALSKSRVLPRAA